MSDFYTKVKSRDAGKVYVPKLGNRYLHRICKRARDAEVYAIRVRARLSRGRQFLIASSRQKIVAEEARVE